MIVFFFLPPKSDQPLLSLKPLWPLSLSTFSKTVFQNSLAQTLPLVSLTQHTTPLKRWRSLDRRVRGGITVVASRSVSLDVLRGGRLGFADLSLSCLMWLAWSPWLCDGLRDGLSLISLSFTRRGLRWSLGLCDGLKPKFVGLW